MRRTLALLCVILTFALAVGAICALWGCLSQAWAWDQRHIALVAYAGALACMGLGYALGSEIPNKP